MDAKDLLQPDGTLTPQGSKAYTNIRMALCPKCKTPLNPGKMLSDLRTPEQVRAAAEGGKKGGRPRKVKP